MKKNSNFIWIYVAILFSFALILIVFAGLTQNNYQKEIADQKLAAAGVQNSLTAVTKENEKTKAQNKALKEQNEKIQAENDLLYRENQTAMEIIGGDKVVTKNLLAAYWLKTSDPTEENINKAKKSVKDIKTAELTAMQKEIYNKIIGE